MADIALYRKYRPQDFDNLVGQDHVRRTLLNAIKAGHLSHAYLFCGPRGTGKTTTARLVAKAINCIAPETDGESCNKCEYCTLMNEGRLMDLIEIDAASNRGIDEIRDLREKIKFSPNQAPHKVYIIDEVHMLTTPAFNALLKTLEEPPDHAYFVLATTEVHKVPDTILSRCQRFDFRRIEETVIVERLKELARQEQIQVEEKALELVARAAEGGLRNAISLFEQIAHDGHLMTQDVLGVLGLTGHEAVSQLLKALEEQDIQRALREIQTLHQDGQDLYHFNRAFLNELREQLLKNILKKEEMRRLLGWIDLFQKSAQEIKMALIPQLPLELAVIQACLPEEAARASWLSGLWSKKEDAKPTSDAELKSATKDPTHDSKKILTKAPDGLKTLPEEPPAEDSEEESEAISSAISSTVLSLKSIHEKLPRLLDAIRTPAVRQSFRTGVIQGVQGSTVFVDFQSKFHLEKVNTIAAKSEIESAFKTVFGHLIIFKFQLTDVNKVVDATLEIFGGEVVE